MSSPWPIGYGRRALHVLALLGASVLIAFAPFLFGGQTLLASARDAASLYPQGARATEVPGPPRVRDPGAPAWQNEPWLGIEHRALAEHVGPWWDPYDGFGHPFAASQQTQPFFPLTFAAALHPGARSYDWFVAARLFVAGAFAALFMLWFAGRAAAFAAGAGTMLSGYYLLHVSMPHLSVEVLIPALLWSSEWMVRRPHVGAIAASGALFGLAVAGGMPESLVVAVATAALYYLIRIVGDGGFSLLRLAPFAGALVFGAVLSGVMLAPLAELLALSFDTHRTAALPPGMGTDGLHPLRALLVQLAPLAFGPPTLSLPIGAASNVPTLYGFAGSVTVFGALLAVIASFANRGTARSAGRAEGSAIAALGAIAGLYFLKNQGFAPLQALGGLPVFRLVIWEKYDQAALDVALALLAGFGIALAQQRRAQRPAVLGALGTVLAVISLAYVWAVNKVPLGAFEFSFFGSVGLALIAACAAAAVAGWLPRGRAGALAALLVADLVAAYYVPFFLAGAGRADTARDTYAGAPYVSMLQGRVGGGGDRVLGLAGMLVPNWAGAFGLDDPGAVDALYPRGFLPFVDAFLPPAGPFGDRADRFDGLTPPSLDSENARRFLALASVRYVVVPPTARLRAAHLALVYDRDARVYRFDGALARASIFHDVLAVRDQQAALRALTDPTVDVRRTLVIAGGPSARDATRPAGETASFARPDAMHVQIDAHLARPGYVMLNDTYYPGWAASVDGRDTAIAQADFLFRAVPVPAGDHRIVYSYRSAAVGRGIALSLTGIVLLAACAVFGVLRNLRRRAVSAGERPAGEPVGAASGD